MKRVLTMVVLGAGVVTAASPSWAQAPQVRLTWLPTGTTTCTTPVRNQDFSATTFSVAVIATNIQAADQCYGNEMTITIGPNVPDAWRFDDQSGCQTSAGVAFTHAAINKSTCPTLIGTNSSDINATAFNPVNNTEAVRITVTHDPFTPTLPNTTTYTMWRVTFDHSASVTGPSGAGTCGGAEQIQCIGLNNAQLNLSAGPNEPFIYAVPQDQFIWWNNPSAPNSGCAVPTQASTWGRLKGQYR